MGLFIRSPFVFLNSASFQTLFRYALVTVLLPLTLLSFAYFYNYHNAKLTILNDIETKQTFALRESNVELRSTLNSALTDLRFMANNTVIKQYFASKNNENRQLLENFYADLLSSKVYLYDQLRYMDEAGNEVIRINNADSLAERVPVDQLQNKSQRYYFKKGLKLAENEVYVSPFDLNLEKGQVELPIKPTLRFASRAIDQQSREQGVLAINFLGKELIKRLKAINEEVGMNFWLLNQSAYWLSSPSPEEEWGFMFPDRQSRKLSSTNTSLWEKISSTASSKPIHIHHEGNVYSVSLFTPSSVQIGGGINLIADSETDWYLVSYTSADAINESIFNQLQKYVVSFVFVTLFIVGLGFYTALLLSRRRITMNAITERENEFNALLESAPDAIIVTDEKGNIRLSNARVESMFGWAREFLAGQPVEVLVGADLRHQHQQYRKSYTSNPLSRTMAEGRLLFASHRDGHQIPVTVGLNSYLIGKERRVIAIVRDVTDMHRMIESEKNAKQHLQKVMSELSEVNQNLRVSNRELEAFSYSVSHDLRTPLRAIDGFSKILLVGYADKLDEAGSSYLNRIRTASQRLGHLIDDILNLSRISRSEIKRENFNISELAEASILSLRESYPARKVKVTIQPDLWVNADPKLIRVLLDNLLGNAWKFTSNTENAYIEFGLETKNAKPEFFVCDNGAGFDMKYANKLFEAFQRLHTAQEFSGTGIGLATVARILGKHGGDIRAEGEEGKGATFWFTLGT